TIEHQALLLRVEVERPLLLAALQFAQPADLLLDRGEVRQHPAEPALRHIERVRPLGLALDDWTKLALRADEQHAVSARDHVPHQRLRQLDLTRSLLEIDDVDAVALREDELPHLRVPTARLVAEVYAGLEEVLNLGCRHPAPFGLFLPPPSSTPPTTQCVAPAGTSGDVIDRWRSAPQIRSRPAPKRR